MGRLKLGAEWAALQVYARAKDGPQYPVAFRPYRGLQPFEERDRRFYFGRSRLTRELLAQQPNAPAMVSELQGGWFSEAGGRLAEDQGDIDAAQ